MTRCVCCGDELIRHLTKGGLFSCVFSAKYSLLPHVSSRRVARIIAKIRQGEETVINHRLLRWLAPVAILDEIFCFILLAYWHAAVADALIGPSVRFYLCVMFIH